MAIIGIDLGTTNSLAAVWQDGQCRLIPNASGEFLTPSAVSIDEDGAVLVGQAARDRLISHPGRTAARFKRYMGTDKVFQLGDRQFKPEELSALVLRSLREDAEAYLGEPVTEAVISVPAYFAEPQRSATKRAGALAGLRVERLVRQAERCKIALTTRKPVLMVVENDGAMASLELTNEWMISACGPLFQRMAAPAKRVFLDAGMSVDELDELVMVGGSSHMPSVRRYISRLLGRKPAEDSRPDTAIALGRASAPA